MKTLFRLIFAVICLTSCEPIYDDIYGRPDNPIIICHYCNHYEYNCTCYSFNCCPYCHKSYGNCVCNDPRYRRDCGHSSTTPAPKFCRYCNTINEVCGNCHSFNCIYCGYLNRY